MHNGFYEELDSLLEDVDSYTDFGFMENEFLGREPSGLPFSAYDFLHGFCNVFAEVLSEEFGYKVECLYNEDGSLIHAYCINESPLNGIVFIDVRGTTSSYEELIEEFEDECTFEGIYPIENTERYESAPEKICAKDKIYKNFAKKLIDNYREYYKS